MKRDPIKMKMMKIREKMERILWYKNLLMIKIGGQLEVKISEKTRIDSNIIDHWESGNIFLQLFGFPWFLSIFSEFNILFCV